MSTNATSTSNSSAIYGTDGEYALNPFSGAGPSSMNSQLSVEGTEKIAQAVVKTVEKDSFEHACAQVKKTHEILHDYFKISHQSVENDPSSPYSLLHKPICRAFQLAKYNFFALLEKMPDGFTEGQKANIAPSLAFIKGLNYEACYAEEKAAIAHASNQTIPEPYDEPACAEVKKIHMIWESYLNQEPSAANLFKESKSKTWKEFFNSNLDSPYSLLCFPIMVAFDRAQNRISHKFTTMMQQNLGLGSPIATEEASAAYDHLTSLNLRVSK